MQGADAPLGIVPVTSEGRLWVIRGVAILTLLYTTYYIGWRWHSTLNLEALWFSVPLALAETFGLLTAFLMVVSLWRLESRRSVRPPAGLSVDVFITTFDEPLEVIRKTALAAREIRYPHRTYILDDCRRDAVRTLAEDLGVGYMRRETNEHAKAGNLNHALRHTSGEFILQLDADHVPLPHILDRLLGFFGADDVAVVQSPQDFYNTDAFTYRVNEKARRIWDEQRLFFSVIQPGKDHWNAAFFVGSCAVIRRAALQDVGGFSTHSITEDIETSLLLHARGWKTVFYGESLAFGLAPASAAAFHIQHLRWGQGAMQVLRRFNPLTYPGLTLAQRLSYFESLTTYLGGYQRAIFYLAPIIFFLTGTFPIDSPPAEFLPVFVPYLGLMLLNFKLVTRGKGSVIYAERYAMAKFFTHMLAVVGFFARRRLRFHVTPKGAGDVPIRTYAPQLALLALTGMAVGWGVLAQTLGLLDYGVPGWEASAFWINLGWAVWTFSLAAYVIQLSLYLKQQRADYRFRDLFPVHFRLIGDAAEGELQLGITEDLNPAGMGLRSPTPLEPGARVRLVLPLSTQAVELVGEVVRRKSYGLGGAAPVHIHGIRFLNPDPAVRDGIELHCTLHVVPYRRSRYREAIGVLESAAAWLYDARRQPRKRMRLAARVAVLNGDGGPAEAEDAPPAVLEELSPGGARLVTDRALRPGTRIHFDVPGSAIAGAGQIMFSQALETPLGVRFVVGVQREGEERAGARGAGRLTRLLERLGPAATAPSGGLDRGLQQINGPPALAPGESKGRLGG